MESVMIKNLKKELMIGNGDALEPFWDMTKSNGTPLVESIAGDEENVLVTFIWEGDPDLKDVSLYGGFSGGDISKNRLTRLDNTNIWYRTYLAKNNVLSHYYFTLNDHYGDDWEERFKNLVRDPYNDKTFVFPKDEENPNDIESVASVLKLPLSDPQPWVEERLDVNKGTVIQNRFSSNLFKNERRLWIYTPHEYNKNIEYPLVLIFDGDMYNGAIPTPTILDNLISAKKIPPVLAVLIENPERDIELPCNDLYVDCLTTELLPYLRENYSVATDASKIVVAGSSYGGLAATYAGLKRPDVFGNILSQSGSFWWKPDEEYDGIWMVDQFESKQKLPLNIYLDVGLYEREFMIDTNRGLYEVLKTKGYSVQFDEFSGGHDYLCWRGTLANGLISLLGSEYS